MLSKESSVCCIFLLVRELFHRQTVEDRSNVRNYAKQGEQNCYQLVLLLLVAAAVVDFCSCFSCFCCCCYLFCFCSCCSCFCFFDCFAVGVFLRRCLLTWRSHVVQLWRRREGDISLVYGGYSVTVTHSRTFRLRCTFDANAVLLQCRRKSTQDSRIFENINLCHASLVQNKVIRAS